jgi:hypothetical protein
MSNDIEYFPRGSTTTTTKTDEKPQRNHVDRDDLFLGVSSKRKRSQQQQQIKSEQKNKKKKSLDGEDHQDTLYRRLHKQVYFFIFIFPLKTKTSFSFIESYRWCSHLWLYRKNHSV